MGGLRHDPLAAVHEALDRAGCDPAGPPHDFRARCPAHNGDNPDTLHVSIGADGRALLWCHRGCDTRDVIAALGLAWGDLFPPGHRHAHPLPGIAKPCRPVDLVLAALRELGINYGGTRTTAMWAADRCPACDHDRYPLWVFEDHRGRVGLSCFNGCEQTAVLAALIGECKT
jgi:hypothetical protein